MAFFVIASAAHAADSVSIGVSSDPTEDKPVTVTVTGTSEAARQLFVYREYGGGGDCATTASTQSSRYMAVALANGVAIDPGPFSRALIFTPTDAADYTICAYLSDTSYSSPWARDMRVVSARLPTGSLNLAFSPDPSEDKPVTVTVTGTAEVATQLFVYRELGSASCATTAGEQSSRYTATALANGVGVNAGSFSRTMTFTPTDAGDHRICAYLAETSYFRPHATTTEVASVRFPTSSLALGFSADPTEDEPVTVTVTGTSEVTRRLYAYRESGGSACASTAGVQASRSGVTTLADGVSVGPGAINRALTFTPSDAGDHRICAYLAESSYTVALATSTAVATVRLPTGSLALAFSADPTEDEPVTVTVSGSSEASRRLYVYRELGGAGCASTAGVQAYRSGVTTLADGVSVSGDIDRTFTFTPSESGDHRICAYLAESSYTVVLATSTQVTSVRTPTGSLSAAFSSDATEDEPVTVTVSGNSEASRRLYVYREFGGSGCASTAGVQSYRSGVATLADGVLVGPGAINRTLTFTPSDAGDHRICAYLAETSAATPLATETQVVAVRLPTGSLSMEFSADPVEDKPVTVTVTGTSEASRRLYVYRELGGSGCATTAGVQAYRSGVATLADGVSVGGAIDRNFTFTPADAGDHRICAYLAETSATAPLATETKVAAVRLPTGSLSLRFSPDPVEDKPVTVTVTGSSEAARRLYAYRELGGSGCASTAGVQAYRSGVATLADGVSVGPGSIDRALTFTPADPGGYRVCAYLSKSSTTAPLATSTAVAQVANDPSDDPAPPKSPLDDLPTQRQPERAPAADAPAIVVTGPAAGVRQQDRRPTFTWVARAGFNDDLVITDASGEFLFVIDKSGTYAPADEESLPARDEDDYAEDETDPSREGDEVTTMESRSVTRVGSARVESAGASNVVKLKNALPPGGYRWHVERSSAGFNAVRSEPRPFSLLGPNLTRLRVRPVAHRGRSSRNPGQTKLRITTTPYASVRIRVTRGGREQILHYDWGARSAGVVNFKWTCRSKGGAAYRYSVIASDARGKKITRRGRFSTVSKGKCQAMRRHEREVARRKAAAERRRAARERQREIQAQRKEYQRLLHNCTALGGQLRELSNRDGSYTLRCLGPWGNFLPFNT